MECLLVKNVSCEYGVEYTRLALWRLFSPNGDVDDVLLDAKRSQAYITFISALGAQEAYLKMNGTLLFGRELCVAISPPLAVEVPGCTVSYQPSRFLYVPQVGHFWISTLLRRVKGVESVSRTGGVAAGDSYGAVLIECTTTSCCENVRAILDGLFTPWGGEGQVDSVSLGANVLSHTYPPPLPLLGVLRERGVRTEKPPLVRSSHHHAPDGELLVHFPAVCAGTHAFTVIPAAVGMLESEARSKPATRVTAITKLGGDKADVGLKDGLATGLVAHSAAVMDELSLGPSVLLTEEEAGVLVDKLAQAIEDQQIQLLSSLQSQGELLVGAMNKADGIVRILVGEEQYPTRPTSLLGINEVFAKTAMEHTGASPFVETCIRGINSRKLFSTVTLATFLLMLPLLQQWLRGSARDARHAFHLLYEGVRVFGSGALLAPGARRSWRTVSAILQDAIGPGELSELRSALPDRLPGDVTHLISCIELAHGSLQVGKPYL